MAIDTYVSAVRQQISEAFGETADLSEELVNTICNLYYFAEKGRNQNMGGLTDLQKIHPATSTADLLPMYLDHMGHVAFATNHAPELIKKLRAVRVENETQFDYFENIALDLLKYRIDGPEKKSGISRTLERKQNKPNEHVGLARKFKVAFRGSTALADKVFEFNDMEAPMKQNGPVASESRALGRNELCHCGSGKRFKHCHGQLS